MQKPNVSGNKIPGFVHPNRVDLFEKTGELKREPNLNVRELTMAEDSPFLVYPENGKYHPKVNIPQIQLHSNSDLEIICNTALLDLAAQTKVQWEYNKDMSKPNNQLKYMEHVKRTLDTAKDELKDNYYRAYGIESLNTSKTKNTGFIYKPPEVVVPLRFVKGDEKAEVPPDLLPFLGKPLTTKSSIFDPIHQQRKLDKKIYKNLYPKDDSTESSSEPSGPLMPPPPPYSGAVNVMTAMGGPSNGMGGLMNAIGNPMTAKDGPPGMSRPINNIGNPMTAMGGLEVGPPFHNMGGPTNGMVGPMTAIGVPGMGGPTHNMDGHVLNYNGPAQFYQQPPPYIGGGPPPQYGNMPPPALNSLHIPPPPGLIHPQFQQQGHLNFNNRGGPYM